MALRIFLTFLIWVCTYPILILIGFPVVAYKLHNGWDGSTGWWGNWKYGRHGNKEFQTNGIFWREWLFLAVRNPISNFGKQVLSARPTEPLKIKGDVSITDGWPGIPGYYYIRSGKLWEIRFVYPTFPYRCFEARFGWKLLGGGDATFVFRFNPFRRYG